MKKSPITKLQLSKSTFLSHNYYNNIYLRLYGARCPFSLLTILYMYYLTKLRREINDARYRNGHNCIWRNSLRMMSMCVRACVMCVLYDVWRVRAPNTYVIIVIIFRHSIYSQVTIYSIQNNTASEMSPRFRMCGKFI